MLQPLSPCFFDRCFCQSLAGFVFLLDIMQICSFLTLINNYPHKGTAEPMISCRKKRLSVQGANTNKLSSSQTVDELKCKHDTGGSDKQLGLIKYLKGF